MNNIILVPTDFSELCMNALKQAVDLAYNLNYKVVLLHVINSDTVAYFKKSLSDDLIIKKLTSLKNEIKNISNVNVEFIYKEGSVYTVISEVAKKINANFVVFGSRGKTGIQHLTDDYAIKIMKSLKNPCISVSEKFISLESNNIVVPINIYYDKGICIDWIVYIAKLFNAKIHLYVQNIQRNDLIEKETEILNIIKNIFDFNSIKYLIVRHIKGTDLCEQILNYSITNNADMIMLFTSEKKSVSKHILNPWNSDLIFNKAGIPVICANPRKLRF